MNKNPIDELAEMYGVHRTSEGESDRMLRKRVLRKLKEKPSFKMDLEIVLNEFYSRYTVKRSRDIKKAGIIELHIPGKIISPDFCCELEQIKPFSILIKIIKLPWWKNIFRRKKWTIKDK